jgi:tetratricopeptide (TPR) repeat protein
MVKTLLKLCLLCAIVLGCVKGVQMYFHEMKPRERASWHMTLGEYKEALPYLAKAAQESPTTYSIYLEIAECYDRTQDKAKAMQYYRAVAAFGEPGTPGSIFDQPGNGYYRDRYQQLVQLGK